MELYPYQEEGVQAILSRPYFLLADGMGLGKTIQAIEAVNRIPNPKRVLIVCPATIKYNWVQELKTWLKHPLPIKVISKRKDTVLHRGINITSWHLLNDIRAQIRGREWDYMILDEAHRIKNPAAKRTRLILGNRLSHNIQPWCNRVLMLTGTPVLNKPIELFPILKVFAPDTIEGFTDVHSFGMRFCGGREVDGFWDYSGNSNLEELNARLRPFMLRRTIEQVRQELPSVVTKNVYLDEVPIPDDIEEKYTSTAMREIGLAKLPYVIKYLKELLETENKVVAFAHHRDIIESIAKDINGSVILYGGLSSEEKQSRINQFINDSNTRLFVGQIQAAGEGIDGLQKVCNQMVFCEFNWSPAMLDQAIARLQRIGQTSTVFVHFLIASHADLEHAVLGTASQKRRVITQIVTQEYKETPDMSLESEVKKTNVLLERLVDHLTGGTPVGPEKTEAPTTQKTEAPPAPAPEPEKPAKKPAKKDPKKPTNDEVKAAAQRFLDSAGTEPSAQERKFEEATAILNNLGAQTMADLDESKYAEAIEIFDNGHDVKTRATGVNAL